MGVVIIWVIVDVLKMVVDVTVEMVVEITLGDVRRRG